MYKFYDCVPTFFLNGTFGITVMSFQTVGAGIVQSVKWFASRLTTYLCHMGLSCASGMLAKISSSEKNINIKFL